MAHIAFQFCTDEGLERLKTTNKDIIDRLQVLIDNAKIELNAINSEIDSRKKKDNSN